MISLIILPVLITVYVNKLYNTRGRQRTMEINWNATNRPEIAAISPFPDTYLPLSPKRNWSEVELTGNQITNKIKLATVRAQIKDLTNSRDTTIGVHFALGKGATYGAFVSVLNYAADRLRINLCHPGQRNMDNTYYSPVKPQTLQIVLRHNGLHKAYS